MTCNCYTYLWRRNSRGADCEPVVVDCQARRDHETHRAGNLRWTDGAAVMARKLAEDSR